MFNDFPKFMHFFAFRYIYKSNDNDFVCRRLISEMQHAPETRLPFSDDVVVAVLVVVVVASVADVAINKNRLNALTRLVPYIHISRL